jgi:uncharacterized protein YraI
MTRRITKIILITVLALGSLLPVASSLRPASAQAATAAAWRAEYYGNIYLSGPAVTRTESSLSLNWGAGAPAPGVPADYFSARYGTDVYLASGTYRFTVQADDEVSVKIGYNQWEPPIINTIDDPKPGQTLTADVTLNAGTHHIQVDFRERTGYAYLYVSWAPISGGPQPGPIYDTQPIATVTTGALNVRAVPDPVNGAILTRIYRGQTYAVVGRSGLSTWWQLDVNGTIGWVNGNYVRVQNGQNAPVRWHGHTGDVYPPAPQLPVVQCPGFALSRLTPGGWGRVTPGLPNNLRAQASANSAWVGSIPGGAGFYVITGPVCGYNTAWWQVNYNGIVGWAMEGFGSTYWLQPW